MANFTATQPEIDLEIFRRHSQQSHEHSIILGFMPLDPLQLQVLHNRSFANNYRNSFE